MDPVLTIIVTVISGLIIAAIIGLCKRLYNLFKKPNNIEIRTFPKVPGSIKLGAPENVPKYAYENCELCGRASTLSNCGFCKKHICNSCNGKIKNPNSAYMASLLLCKQCLSSIQ